MLHHLPHSVAQVKEASPKVKSLLGVESEAEATPTKRKLSDALSSGSSGKI